MRQWLVQQYGRASRIVNDIIDDLVIRTKPRANDNNAFFSHIAGPLQRVERWSTIVEIIKVELPSYVEQSGSGITSQDSYDLDNKDAGEWFGLQESYWS